MQILSSATVETGSGFVLADKNERRFRVDHRAYSDTDIFARERDTIFQKCWLYLGHGSELPTSGSYLTRTVGGFDLIAVRTQTNEVHAYFNACTHRGATLCREKAGKAKTFSCAYHGWVFDSERGRLLSQATTSGYPKNFNELGLYNLRRPARIDSYRDFYFINFNENAIGLQEYLGDAREYIDLVVDQADDGLEVIAGQQSFTSAGNWKLLIENNQDAYHGPILHSTYFEILDQRAAQANMVGTQTGVGLGLGNGHGAFELNLRTGRPVAQWIPAFGEDTRPKIEAIKRHLTEKFGTAKADKIAESHRNLIIFPNLVITDNLAVSVRTVNPIAPNVMTASIWALGPKNEDPFFRKLRLDNYLTFVGPGGFATPDDIEIFDLCQRGLQYTAGLFSDFSKGMETNEDPLHARGAFSDESQMRGWWTQWDRIISGAERLEV